MFCGVRRLNQLSSHLLGTCIRSPVLGAGAGGEAKMKKTQSRDFPGGVVVKNLPAKAGDMGSIPGLGRSHMLRSN